MSGKGAFSGQLGLFDPDSERIVRIRGISDWPEAERHPLNLGAASVADVVMADLQRSDEALIVTGYSSLEYIIARLGRLHEQKRLHTRLLIGSEPVLGQRPFAPVSQHSLPEEVRDYWLNEGMSIENAPELFMMIEKLESGEVEARYIPDGKKRLHAKIYVADDAVTTGSSNFSHSGMHVQHEFNCRYTRTGDRRRFRDTRQAAENFWRMGEDYGPELLDLLKRLLRAVSFEEAVARACAELLEGEWAKRYLNRLGGGMVAPLWPSQLKGIARALWIIENEGSCLIADATGAGKTRMGAHLLKAVANRMWSKGRVRNDMMLLISPPGVVAEAWDEERSRCGLNLVTHSHGILSRASSEGFKVATNDLRRAQCIAIDEAHNFLNQQSSRTRSLLCNMADHVLLFTATPINRGIRDLIHIVDLLGADNLDDASLKLFDALAVRLRRQRNHFAISEEERRRLRRLVGRFTLRRTKSDLKREIALQPDAYTDAYGKRCSYPKHALNTYDTSESEADQALAREIRALAGELRGLVNLQSGVEMPASLRGFMTPEIYVNARLKSAKGLAIYRLMASLRSSRPALVEHILGTDCAAGRFRIHDVIKAEKSGNMLGRLQGIRGQVHDSSLASLLPRWLTDRAAHAEAVEREIEIYKRILTCVERMSVRRDVGKADLLARLHKRHKLLIGFDSCLITLSYLQRLLVERGFGGDVWVATSNRPQERKRVGEALRLGSEGCGIALCSDALSEGINLQQASAVVLLDMPSVIRIAEQRIGRVDRLNSPHREVEVWWPRDSEAFALKTDRKFIQRHADVAELLGANIEIPEEMFPDGLGENLPSTADEMMQEMSDNERAGKGWDGLQDAFYPVRTLIEGDAAVVRRPLYEQIRDSQARILSTIAVVRTQRPWAFFAIAGNHWGAPKWVYFDAPDALPETDLQEVAAHLRAVREEACTVIDPRYARDDVAYYLERFRERLEQTEILLLPRRKQRALEEMRYILTRYLEQARQEADDERAGLCDMLLNAASDPPSETACDLDSLAECWLDLVRDPWFDMLMSRRRRIRPLRLRDLRRRLLEQPMATDQIRLAFEHVALSQSISRRAVVTILGIPNR